MDRVYREWRSPDNPCGGGLVWYWKDTGPGAGWGVLDHRGEPKAAFYYLRRAWAPLTVSLLDRSLDGLAVQLLNESGEAFEGSVVLEVFHRGRVRTAREEAAIALPPRGDARLSADEVFGRFLDLTWSYRFGPPKHEAVVATLVDSAGRSVAQDVHRLRPGRVDAPEISVDVSPADGPGRYHARVASSHLLLDVRVASRKCRVGDQYFHLIPGWEKHMELYAAPEVEKVILEVDAAELDAPLTLHVDLLG